MTGFVVQVGHYENVRTRNDPKGPVHEESYTYTLKVIEEGSRHPVKEHKLMLTLFWGVITDLSTWGHTLASHGWEQERRGPSSAPVVELIFRWQEVAGPFPQTPTWWVHFIRDSLPE